MKGFEPIATDAPAKPDAMIGRVLADRYEIRSLIGEGGMGRVYEGRQRALDRPVAIKCIHPYLLANEPMLVRFMEEARVASQLVHPNIVKIYDFARTTPPDAPAFFLVMELLSGPDLASILRQGGPMPLGRIRSILTQALSALGEAHARGVTHRDAKPDNVILEQTEGRAERVKIIDFGIAKVHGARGVTSVGQFVGTPQYMPPEQIRGEAVEVSADLYAVGVTLFQMLTGRLLFDADTVTAVLEQQLYARRPDPREITPRDDCSDELAGVCLRALDLDVRNRFPSADSFAEALDDAIAAIEPGAETRRSPYPLLASERAAFAESRRSTQPSSVPPRSGARPIDFATAERIERAADAELAHGRLANAEVELRRGLELGNRWLDAAEPELGQAALMVFGRRLGALLRDAGRLEESERMLRSSLAQSEAEELGRGRILAELVATLVERGSIAAAEAFRIEALRIANAHGDRELLARLRRLAQSLALSLVTRGAVAPSEGSGTPPPRRSEWRFKPDIEPPEDLRARRRR